MNKEILKLAIPNIISNLSVPMMSLVDVALMGHMESELYILAIGFGTLFFNFIYWGFGFLRMGTTGLTAQAYGKKDKQESRLILVRGLLVAFSGGLLIILLQYPVFRLGAYLIDTDPSVVLILKEYFDIRIFAAPATIAGYAFIGWFLGMQNAKIPMFLTITVNIINLLLNFLFVKYYGMKADGVALGTLIAQYVGLILSFVLFYRYFHQILPRWRIKEVFHIPAIKRFLSVNSDIIIRTLCLIFTFSFFKVQSGHEGLVTGAANIVLLEYLTIVAFGVDGFAFAAESIVGKYFGARDTVKLKLAIKKSFVWGLGLALIFTAIFAWQGKTLLYILTDQVAVIHAAYPYMVWVIIAPVINTVPFIWDGVYIGVTASKAMRNTMLIATFLCFLPAYYLFGDMWGNHGLWVALTLFFLARGLAQTWIARKVIRFDR